MRRGNVAALAAYNAFRGFAVGGFMTLLPMYMRSLGYSMGDIGGVISASSLGLSLFLPAIGYVIDRWGPRRMIAATGLVLAAAPLAAASSTSLAGVGAAYALFLFSFLAGQPARMSFLAATVGGASMGSAVGLTSSLFSASRTLGPWLSGAMAGALGFREAFHALALIALAGLAVFMALSEPVESPGRPPSVAEAYRALLRPGRAMALVLGYVALDRVAWSLWFPLLSAHLYGSGYSEEQAGLLITASGGVQTLLMPVAGRAADRAGSWAALAASEALGIAAALLYADPHPWSRAAAAAGVMGASIALWVPGYNALIARAAGGSGSAYAAANTARSLAGAPAPYAGGLLYDALGSWAAFAASAVLLAAAAGYAYLLLRRVEAANRRGPASSYRPP